MVELLLPLLDDIDPSQGVRLLGVHASKLSLASGRSEPQTLFDLDDLATTDSAQSSTQRAMSAEHQWSDASQAVDSIVAKFGRHAITPASALGSDAVGENPFGPSGDDE